MFNYFLLIALLLSGIANAQFPGPAGTVGTTAMSKDSSAFVAWASSCKITRGLQHIGDPSLGFTTVGDSTSAIGPAGTGTVVSLGDGGVAILEFSPPISDQPGFDFAVFENAFNDSFLELAFVEVSSNGEDFYRFGAVSNTQVISQIGPFDNTGYASLLNNLAGKYRGGFGTPFELSELYGMNGLDLSSITHVKIIDVIGSVFAPYGSFDVTSNQINDPFPTPFPSSGFDLDAVGVIHSQSTALAMNSLIPPISVFPNPISEGQSISILSNDEPSEISIFDLHGSLLFHGNSDELNHFKFPKGFFTANFRLKDTTITKRIISK
jgi:hypothetical protein